MARAKTKPVAKETASAHFSVNVTPSEMELIRRAAEVHDRERFPSRWIRKLAIQKAVEVLGGVGVGVEPDRKKQGGGR